MAVRKPKFSLFAKFSLGICTTVLVFGALNALIVRHSVTSSLVQEFERRGYFIARTLAEQSAAFILSGNLAGLNTLVNEVRAIDTTVQYALVLTDAHAVLAHTFPGEYPAGLIPANSPGPGEELKMVLIRDSSQPGVVIRDFAVPVLNRDLGVVRIGILETDIQVHVRSIQHKIWLMVVLFLILGVLGALFFSHTISLPLKTLSQQSEVIDLKTIQAGIDNLRGATRSFYYRVRRLFNSDDEIDILYENYSGMLQRLEQTHLAMNRMQQSLMQAEKMAALGTLTAGIAHEINNPLAGMGIGLKRIARHPEDAEQLREYTAMMQEALSRVEQVVKDLLTFSRKGHLAFEEVDVCQLVEKSIKLAQYRIRSHNIDIELNRSGCPCRLVVSPNRIEQVLLNIIINAMDAIVEKMQELPLLRGSIRIHLAWDGPGLRIVIADNGKGMDSEQAARVFDPFYTTKKVGEGTGLGLSVSYQIVQDHGGKILVESTPGEGSRFIVVLPARPPKDPETQPTG
jgi:two-component system NtrC family sensor kinase